MAIHNEIGKIGENAAAQYLQRYGYTICSRNFRYGKGEIDLIAEFHGEIVFVEVKTRRSQSYGLPREAITAHKVNILRQTAMAYLVCQKKDVPCRFDVVEVTFRRDGSLRVNHLQNAF